MVKFVWGSSEFIRLKTRQASLLHFNFDFTHHLSELACERNCVFYDLICGKFHQKTASYRRKEWQEGHNAETLVHLLIWPEHIKHLNYIDFGLAPHTNTPGHPSFCISYKS